MGPDGERVDLSELYYVVAKGDDEMHRIKCSVGCTGSIGIEKVGDEEYLVCNDCGSTSEDSNEDTSPIKTDRDLIVSLSQTVAKQSRDLDELRLIVKALEGEVAETRGKNFRLDYALKIVQDNVEIWAEQTEENTHALSGTEQRNKITDNVIEVVSESIRQARREGRI